MQSGLGWATFVRTPVLVPIHGTTKVKLRVLGNEVQPQQRVRPPPVLLLPLPLPDPLPDEPLPLPEQQGWQAYMLAIAFFWFKLSPGGSV